MNRNYFKEFLTFDSDYQLPPDVDYLLSAVGDCLYGFYYQPHRHYHNINHIINLRHEYLVREPIASQYLSDVQIHIVMYLSILFHDVIYNVTAPPGENEFLSAKMARCLLENDIFKKYLTQIIIKHESTTYDTDYTNIINLMKHYVSNIIMSTTNHSCNENFIEPKIVNYFLDLDLSILSSISERYSEYSLNIREEYGFLPDEVFYPARLNIINKFLEQCSNNTLFKVIPSSNINAKNNLENEKTKILILLEKL